MQGLESDPVSSPDSGILGRLKRAAAAALFLFDPMKRKPIGDYDIFEESDDSTVMESDEERRTIIEEGRESARQTMTTFGILVLILLAVSGPLANRLVPALGRDFKNGQILVDLILFFGILIYVVAPLWVYLFSGALFEGVRLNADREVRISLRYLRKALWSTYLARRMAIFAMFTLPLFLVFVYNISIRGDAVIANANSAIAAATKALPKGFDVVGLGAVKAIDGVDQGRTDETVWLVTLRAKNAQSSRVVTYNVLVNALDGSQTPYHE